MKSTKILAAGLLLMGAMQLNAQTSSLFESSAKTGYGLQNGAIQTNLPSTNGSAFFGYQAGFQTTGNSNSFFGHSAGFSNTTGQMNVFVGQYAGYYAKGSNNTFTGYYSGYGQPGAHNTSNNTFYGYLSGNKITSGTNNIFTGIRAGYTTTTGSNNIFVGTDAGSVNIGGSGNVFIGNSSGSSIVSGADNTSLGYLSGFSATGSRNVYLGVRAGYSATGNDKLFIANSNTSTPLIYGDFAANKVGIGGINTFPTADKFPATAGDVSVSNYTLFVRGGILTEEVRVNLLSGWADYVFAKDYRLLSLPEVEQYINKYGHLPNIPSAQQVKKEGIELGQMTNLQQEKIEELTLYIIQQDKELEAQNARLLQQEKEINELKAAVKTLLDKQ